MTTHAALFASPRPIRELACPDVEDPKTRGRPDEERRQAHRYPRRLPGFLSLDETEFPVTCLDIGYGGMLVDAPPTAKIALGNKVVVRIDLGGTTFQDEFSVVHTEYRAEGTTVHLGQ